MWGIFWIKNIAAFLEFKEIQIIVDYFENLFLTFAQKSLSKLNIPLSRFILMDPLPNEKAQYGYDLIKIGYFVKNKKCFKSAWSEPIWTNTIRRSTVLILPRQ